MWGMYLDSLNYLQDVSIRLKRVRLYTIIICKRITWSKPQKITWCICNLNEKLRNQGNVKYHRGHAYKLIVKVKLCIRELKHQNECLNQSM